MGESGKRGALSERDRLEGFLFTRHRAVRLVLYAWVFASLGLGLYVCYLRFSFDTASRLTALRLADSLEAARTVLENARGAVPAIEGPAVRPDLGTVPVGPADLRAEEVSLARVRGQKRRLGEDLLEVRFRRADEPEPGG